MNSNISYIILHYKNMDVTTKCLENLKKTIGKNSHIIIVDNNTLTNDEELILKKYTNDILKLEDNYGYAKANNKGINYAKEKYQSDFFVIMNNDVIIKQNDFEKEIAKMYKEYNFDMLGPKIESPTGESINPFPVLKTNIQVDSEIKKCEKLITIYQNTLLFYLLKIYLIIKQFLKPIKSLENSKELLLNVSLHGCAIIFSKNYINKYEYPFYNETFLFHEEEFLYNRVIKDKLTSVYDPNLNVFHMEGSSVKKSNKNERLSKLFREKERLKSLKLLSKYMR